MAGPKNLVKIGRLWCFPKENKGVFRKTGERGRIFLGDYGYHMGTLNSQTHFKIGDASLFNATFSSDIKLLIDI